MMEAIIFFETSSSSPSFKSAYVCTRIFLNTEQHILNQEMDMDCHSHSEPPPAYNLIQHGNLLSNPPSLRGEMKAFRCPYESKTLTKLAKMMAASTSILTPEWLRPFQSFLH
jgi:hypothetical protein